MITNWLKNALIALVLNAIAAYAFNSGNAAPASDIDAPAQACLVPMQLSADATALHTNQPDNNGAQS